MPAFTESLQCQTSEYKKVQSMGNGGESGALPDWLTALWKPWKCKEQTSASEGRPPHHRSSILTAGRIYMMKHPNNAKLKTR